MIKVNIIVPVYNTKKYLNKCIHSVLHQSYQNIKLILIDDGSTDGSGKICDKWAKKDKRIQVVHQKNSGPVRARAAGIRLCNNDDYVTFLDSDDYLPHNAIALLAHEAKRYNADLVCGKFTKVLKAFILPEKFQPPCFNTSKPEVYDTERIKKELLISYFGISDFPVNLCGKLYKASIIKKSLDFPVVVKFMGDDLSISLRLMPYIKNLIIIPNSVYRYRLGGGSSKFRSDFFDDFIALYNLKNEFLLNNPIPQNAALYMAIELKNVALTWLQMCKEKGRYSDSDLRNEIDRMCNIKEFISAMTLPDYILKEKNGLRRSFAEGDYEMILNEIERRCNDQKLIKAIKSILK